MRHLKAGRRLGVTTSHRRAMMRNMVTSILEKGEIRCTLARAKEVRKPLEKMITLAKRGDLHARRQALSFVKSKEAMSQLFDELSERYSDRQGGYCRIIKLGQTRLGDNSEMAIVQLIGSENDQLSSLKSTSGKKKPARKSSKVLEKVSEEVRQAEESSEKAAKEEAVEEQVDAPEKVRLRKRLKLLNQKLLQKLKLLSRKRLRRKPKNNRQRRKHLKRSPFRKPIKKKQKLPERHLTRNQSKHLQELNKRKCLLSLNLIQQRIKNPRKKNNPSRLKAKKFAVLIPTIPQAGIPRLNPA